jgi:lipoprotein-anchoring transpeptidase ErfK/SrfK
MLDGGQQLDSVKEELAELSDKWLFSKTFYPQDGLCSSYKVAGGDQLRNIAKQFKVPWQILAEINHIRPETLPAGGTIKVVHGPFHAKVNRSTFTMDIYLQEMFVKSFKVGLGKAGYETPTGLWMVAPGGKMEKTVWTDPDTGKVYYPDDPNYPLGSRWIKLDGIEGAAKDQTGFGIHGTNDPDSIGNASSRGCIRLHNGDAILVYNLLEPGASRVRVVD